MNTDVLIVGASVAGIGAANELRRLGYRGSITIVDEQPHLPYDRPPLSKAVLTGAAMPDAVSFHDRKHYVKLDISLKLGARAVDLDAGSHRVRLDSGEDVVGDAVIIASGARARAFPADEYSGPVWTIRDLEDARRLAPLLAPGKRLAVVGGGFIGAEVAASARQRGCEVTLVEMSPLPFEPLLGSEVASLLAQLHRRAGTTLRAGVAVQRVERRGPEQRIHLSDGTSFDADVVVAGLGAVPNVEWLAESKIVVDGAVACDEHGRTAVAGVWAAGDVSTWFNPTLGMSHRHEHWTSAREQARIVAHDIVGEPGPRWQEAVPYVWSDQYGARIQVLGHPAGAETIRIVERDDFKPSFLALYGRDGRLTAVVGCNAAGRVMRYRVKLADSGVRIEDA